MQSLHLPAALGRRARARLTAICVALAFPLLASAQQDAVAVLAHKAPTATEYLLHGTLPIPAGTWDGNTASPTLAIRNHAGQVLPTQMEVVTTSSTGVPEVVELIAKVERPANSQPGEPLEYDVVLFQGEGQPHSIHPGVLGLIDPPGELVMRTTDVFGNEYEADLLRDWHVDTTRPEKSGRWLQQQAGHEVLQPRIGAHDPATALPHMMGAHVFMTTFADAPYIALDLIVHNGMSDVDDEIDEDDLLDDIFFRDLVMEVPAGWRIISLFPNQLEGQLKPNGKLGNQIFEWIKPLPDGKIHVMPRQSRFMRRVMLAKSDPASVEQARAYLARTGLAYARKPQSQSERATQWSWWNPATAFYYPQKWVLPVLTDFDMPEMSAHLDQRRDAVSEQIWTGEGGLYPFTSPALGWAHPWGEPHGGAPGGDEIYFVSGLRTLATGNVNGYRLAELSAKSYMDRQPLGFYDINGIPLRLRDLIQVDNEGRFYASCHFQLVPSGVHDYPRFDEADKTHMERVRKQGLNPDYQAPLKEWNCVDIAHLTRYTHNFKTLTWLGNDALAKEELRMVAETFRLSFHELHSSASGYVQGSGLLAKINYVSEFPGVGVGVGRHEAWGMDVACSAYAISGPEVRTRFMPWMAMFADLLRNGQSECTGNIVAVLIYNHFFGQYTVRQSFEVAMLEQTMLSLCETVFKDVDNKRYNSLQSARIDSTYSSMNEPFWDPIQQGPWFTIGTGLRDPYTTPDLCFDIPQDAHLPHVDYTDSFSAVAYSYGQTGDLFFRRRMEQMLQSAGDALGTDQLVYPLRIEARAAMLAIFESPLPK